MEKILSLLSGVIKMDAEEIKQKAETDEGIKEIEGKINNLNTFTVEELTARDDRLKTEHITELVNAVGKNEVPNELYNRIKGNVMEQLDKDIATKFEIDGFDDHNDLIGKIQRKKSAGDIDPKLQNELDEYKTKITELNKTIEEKENNFVKFKEEQIVNQKKNEILEKYPYAGKSDEEKQAQKEILSSFLDSKFKIGVDEDKPVLLKDGKPVKDNSLNAVDPFEHVVNEMKSYVPQDNGASGGAGNGKPPKTEGGKITTEQFEKEMSEKGATSEEMSREYIQRVNNNQIQD